MKGRGAFPARSGVVLWREVDGEAILFRDDDGRAFALNESAALLWRLCEGSRSADEVADAVAHACGMDAAAAREATTAALDALDAAGALEWAEDRAERSARAETPPASALCAAPQVEEIAFAACDCRDGARGLIRNAQCVDIPRQQVSTI
jgi:hypothetical protein